jgi:hypothetical protein
MWLDHDSIQESLDFHLAPPDAVGFIPMKFDKPHTTVLHPHAGNAFELSPSARAELPPEPQDIVNVAAYGNHFNITDLSDNFKVHRRYPRVRPRPWFSS